MKANRCEVKTWREQFFPGQKGSKHCPSGQYPPFRGGECPQKGSSTLNCSGHQGLFARLFSRCCCCALRCDYSCTYSSMAQLLPPLLPFVWEKRRLSS